MLARRLRKVPYDPIMASTVSVVIPVRNDADALANAVSSVLMQQPDVVAEIVVVVGPSVDGSEAVAAQLQTEIDRLIVVENPSGKTPQALNLGIDHSTGDVVVRVDARSTLPLDYVANALESLDATGAGNVGAMQIPVGDAPTQRAIAAAMLSLAGSGGVSYRTGVKLRRVDTAYLGAFRRDALEDVGGFDITFVRNQDAELNARLNRAGHHVWLDPRLRVDYRPRPSLRHLASQYWQYGWWRQRSIRKHRSAALRQALVPIMVLAMFGSVIALAMGFLWALAVPVLYLVLLAGAAIFARGLTIVERPMVIAALVVMHFCWGSGFIASFFRSLALRK